jgi:tetratricopeptide (TPR) repeat protein
MRVFFKTSFILIVTLFFSMVCLSQSLLEQAFDAQKKGEHEKAIKFYNQVIEADSKNFVAHFNLGLIYFQTKRFSESIKHFNEAIDIEPKRPEPYFGKANAYIEIQNSSKALETLRFGEQACEKIIPYWLMRAQMEIQLEETEIAKLSVNRAYSLNPNELELLIHIGKLFSELKEFAKAEEVFDAAKQKHPDSFLVLSERVRLFVTTGRANKAIQEVESEINKNKLNARLYVLASSIFIDNSRQSAIEWLNKGLSGNAQPKNEILLTLAEIYFNDKNLDQTLKTIDEILLIEPENLLALILKTRVHLQKNENDKALDVIEKVYKLKNRHSEVHELRFLTLQANSKHEEAFFALRTWITQLPYDPKPYHILANLLIENKAFGDACLILESLLSFRPFDMQALEMYAQSATLIGKADVA